MAGLMSRFFELIGLGDPEEEEEEIFEEVQVLPEPTVQAAPPNTRPNVVPLHQNPPAAATRSPAPRSSVALGMSTVAEARAERDRSKIVSLRPQTFTDIMHAVDMLLEESILTISFESVDPNDTPLWLAYLCGAVKALDGTLDQIGNYIYLVAPKNIDYTSHQKQILLKRDSEERNRSSDRLNDRDN